MINCLFFLRLLLPYERHIKGEQDKPLPLAKPRKQDGAQEKASVAGAKSKGVGAKKLKSPSSPKPGSKKDRGETAKGQEQSQVSHNCWLIEIPPQPKFSYLFIWLSHLNLLPEFSLILDTFY